MAILLHGTTRLRALRILAVGSDPNFRESTGGPRAEAFSTCLEYGPFPLGRPEDYALRKAKAFPTEGGSAIIRIDVPDELIKLATEEAFFPLSQGPVQFDEGAGLEELRSAWPRLAKQIVLVER